MLVLPGPLGVGPLRSNFAPAETASVWSAWVLPAGRFSSRSGSGAARTPGLCLATAAAIGLVAAIAAAPANAHPGHADDDSLLGSSTRAHTVIGEDQEGVDDPRGDPAAFSLLRLGPGEGYVVREALARARPGREGRRRSLIYLGHLTDFQIADQQSPARVEFLDPLGEGLRSAWRPQETLVPHQVELTIRQLNQFLRSPVRQGDRSRARLANAVMTGDLADNQQLNETRWVKQLLQGGEFADGARVSDELDPNSGSSDVSEYPPECRAAAEADPPLLDPADADRYVGVQSYEDYPAGSTAADRHNFYDPDQPAGLYSGWPRYEGLMDRAQEPFEAAGLRAPFYVAFGNHDMLAQGNQWANAGFDEIARGCVKVFPAPGAEEFLEELLGVSLSATDRRLLREALELPRSPEPAPLQEAEPPALRSFETLVPPDPDRRFIDRREFKRLFDNDFQADAHGFGLIDAAELEASDGAASYYDFAPTDGIRYIVLDTVSYGGQFPLSAAGNIDHPQFEWLRGKLRRAQRRDELIFVFAHHGIASLTSPVPHEAAPSCRDPATGADRQEQVGPGCDRDPRDSRKPGTASPHQGPDLSALLLRFPNVVSLVAGHSHVNSVRPFGADGGGFWEIKSPAIVDWPSQHRLIELMDNRDGTLSIFATMLNDASTARSPLPEEGPVERFDVAGLASLGRTLSYNDPQAGPEGPAGARAQGVASDRNVELLLPDPRAREPDRDPPDRGREPGRDRERDREPAVDGRAGAGPSAGTTAAAAAAQDVERGGALPLTGLLVLGLLLIAAALLSGGWVARRLSSRRG